MRQSLVPVSLQAQTLEEGDSVKQHLNNINRFLSWASLRKRKQSKSSQQKQSRHHSCSSLESRELKREFQGFPHQKTCHPFRLLWVRRIWGSQQRTQALAQVWYPCVPLSAFARLNEPQNLFYERMMMMIILCTSKAASLMQPERLTNETSQTYAS